MHLHYSMRQFTDTPGGRPNRPRSLGAPILWMPQSAPWAPTFQRSWEFPLSAEVPSVAPYFEKKNYPAIAALVRGCYCFSVNVHLHQHYLSSLHRHLRQLFHPTRTGVTIYLIVLSTCSTRLVTCQLPELYIRTRRSSRHPAGKTRRNITP